MSIQKTVDEIVRLSIFGGPATAALRCLTLDGRVNEQDALKGLSARELAILGALFKKPDVNPEDELAFVLSMRPHGRCALLNARQHGTHAASLVEVKRFMLTPEQVRTVEAAAQAQRLALHAALPEIDRFLAAYGHAALASRLETAAKNMAPLIFHVGDDCYANFYQIGKSALPWEHELSAAFAELRELQGRAGVAVKTLAFCLDVLLSSGSYTRAEELNSCQLTVETVGAHLLTVFQRYVAISPAGAPTRAGFAALTLHEQAQCLAMLREQRLGLGRFVRDINGLNLLKKEDFLASAAGTPVAAGAEAHAAARRLLETVLSSHTGAPFHWDDALLASLLGTDSGLFGPHPFASDLECLIDVVIDAAIVATGSDVGMSRGTRDLQRFHQLWRSQDTAAACESTQADYYCHAVPSRALQALLPPNRMLNLINAVSSRMRYNTWHYAPSYFNIADIPAARGWFHAPRMADIAEGSDQHHAGHVHAAVRHSIRAPQPIRFGSEVLHGLVDLRLMKQSGARYTMDELAVAVAYADVLGLLYQRLADLLLEGNARFAFAFGGKEWIDHHYTTLAAPALAAA